MPLCFAVPYLRNIFSLQLEPFHELLSVEKLSKMASKRSKSLPTFIFLTLRYTSLVGFSVESVNPY